MSKQQQVERELRPVRYPLDPITITDSHALMAITVGAMLNEISAEHYLLDLIDKLAPMLLQELGREMIAPFSDSPPEENSTHSARLQ